MLLPSGLASTVVRLYGPDQANVILLRRVVLAGAANVWERLHRQLAQFPARLLRAGCSTDDLRQLLATPACCLDAGFSRPLAAMLREHALREDEAFDAQQLLIGQHQ